MRVKYIKDMRPRKQETFKEDKYFDDVLKFSEFDNMKKDYLNDLDDWSNINVT